jgi:predicted nucleic acid-binding protein
MNLQDALNGVTRLFLDTAPVIYYVEKHPIYLAKVSGVFDRIDRGELTAVTSPVVLAECLVGPLKRNMAGLHQDFIDLIVHGQSTVFVPVDQRCGQQAAELRVRHNPTLADALQVAAALQADCEAFLTNDKLLQRVTELRVLVLDELESDQ